MQSPTAPRHEPTSSTSPLDSPITVTSSASPSSAAEGDPLVAELAKGVADAINDFKRKLDQRDGDWANVHGQIDIALDLQDYVLTVEPDELGDEYPIKIKITAKVKPDEVLDGNVPSASANNSPRPDFVGVLDRNLASRQKRRVDEDGGDSWVKRQRTGDGAETTMPLITKEDLDQLLSKLRDDAQEDTFECVEHIQGLLQRFNHERLPQPQHRPSVNGSIAAPSPSLERDSNTTMLADVVRREAKLLSSQIKWVEDCRCLASETHGQREETWRTSSAGFHDRARQNREDFQNTILHQQGVQAQTLQQILNEVKAIGLYAQSCKWEVPGEMPGRGMALSHHTSAMPAPVGRPVAAPPQGQQMASYPRATPNGAGRASGNQALPPLPR